MCDKIAVTVFRKLVEDFRQEHGERFAEGALKALSSGIHEYRDYVYPLLGEVPVRRFKAYWQLQHLFKRYRFEHDRYTDNELEARTLEKFRDFNNARSVYTPLKLSTLRVMREARKVCRQILCLPYVSGYGCRNGIKSTRSVRLEDAYLDNKWATVEGFDCPSALRAEFNKLRSLPQSRPVVNRLLKLSKKSGVPLNLCADDLNLILVPKSWKTLRPITPLSVMGLYWSFSVGRYVEECLRMSGLDISSLQHQHQRLAKKYSVSRTHATADLSSASDSIRRDHLNRVVPRWLYQDLKKTFINHLMIDGVKTATSSCLPMGNGATFPVETLYFYCLIRAIGNLLKVKGVYSAYGDDLIYPTRIHSYVRDVFDDLGIRLNGDKTFVESSFRESCGGDYYHGIDVRPALLPEESAEPGRKLSYVSWLYTVTNALLLRWDQSEIPQTYAYLLSEIAYARGEIHQVPRTFPASSGIQMDRPVEPTWLQPFIRPRVFFSEGSVYIQVKFIGTRSPKNRKVLFEDVYLWDTLGGDVQLSVVPPPKPKEGWGRYKCPGMTRELAKWFLMSLSFKDGEVRRSNGPFRTEPARQGEKPRISVTKLSSWS